MQEKIRFIDLFGGVGGFRLGLERANTYIVEWEKVGNRQAYHKGSRRSDKHREGRSGTNKREFRCVHYTDIDKYATAVYNHRFKEDHAPTDVFTLKTSDISDFDMLCAGFPCQAFSIAGRRQGFEDTRGTLFFEICRIARDKRPRLLFLENVKGLLSHDSGRTFAVILESLDELGYDVEWQVFNSKHFGVPQNRERVFIIGHLRGAGGGQVFPIGESHEEVDGIQRQSDYTNTIQKGIKQDRQGSYVIEGSKSAQIRRLTPRECERLQGFPDDWTLVPWNGRMMSDTQRYKMIGNAVTVNVIEAIGRRMMEVGV